MEIKTCEQYVLARLCDTEIELADTEKQLEKCKEQLAQCKRDVTSLTSELVNLKVALQSIARPRYSTACCAAVVEFDSTWEDDDSERFSLLLDVLGETVAHLKELAIEEGKKNEEKASK